MLVKPAGTARYQSRALRRRRMLILIAVVVVIGAFGLTAYSIVVSRNKKNPNPSVSVRSLSFGAKQAEDVNLVAGAIGQYVAASGMLPERLSSTANGGLVLCSVTCDPTTNTVSGLSVYQPSNIQLMNYKPDLVAPNQGVMYLVPGAKCQANGSLGEPNPTPHSMVMLYVAMSGSTVSPQCLVL